jgi:hypothetical protein
MIGLCALDEGGEKRRCGLALSLTFPVPLASKVIWHEFWESQTQVSPQRIDCKVSGILCGRVFD